ncbi:acylphosphatase, partial [Escherichia sp. R-CC3]
MGLTGYAKNLDDGSVEVVACGETIDIVDHQGKWLARGAYSPASQIRARVWTFDPSESIDIAFFSRRLQQAQKWRDWLAQKDGLDSYRLIAGESDGLPGITIDRFGNLLFCRCKEMGVIVRSFPWICNASIKDKESSNVNYECTFSVSQRARKIITSS